MTFIKLAHESIGMQTIYFLCLDAKKVTKKSQAKKTLPSAPAGASRVFGMPARSNDLLLPLWITFIFEWVF
jgi:hypothetical protein